MSESNMDPHDKMRARDVNRVARGEQAPRPAHEPGSISQAPLKPESGRINMSNMAICDVGDDDHQVDDMKTAPADVRFPFTNQTRHCYTRYLEYHRCVQKKGREAPECEKFACYYRSLCPSEWIEKWNEQRELGIFPGPI